MSNNIKIFQQRDFGELISAPITFFIKEFKKIFVTLLIFIGPFIVFNLILTRSLGAAFSQDIFNTLRYGDLTSVSFFSFEIILLYILSILQTAVLYTVLAIYIKLYRIHGSEGFLIQDIWDEFLKRIGQTIAAVFVSAVLIFLGSIFLVIPGIYLAVVFYIFCAVIVFEEIPFSQAFSRVFEVMKGNWWMTFGTFIIMAIIAGIINLIISSVLTMLFAMFGLVV